MHNILKLHIFTLVLLISGCNIGYERDVQQGHVLEQEMVDELRPGMTKRQVLLVLGAPAIADPFHEDRWDYIYTSTPRSGDPTRKHLVLSFTGDELTRIEGDYYPDGSEVQK